MKKELQKGRVRGRESHGGGRSGSEGIVGAPEGMGGPQILWVDIKMGSNYLRRASLGLQKDSKGLKKGWRDSEML